MIGSEDASTAARPPHPMTSELPTHRTTTETRDTDRFDTTENDLVTKRAYCGTDVPTDIERVFVNAWRALSGFGGVRSRGARDGAASPRLSLSCEFEGRGRVAVLRYSGVVRAGTLIKLGMHKMELGDSVYAAERIMKKRTRKVSLTPCDTASSHSVHNVLTKPEITYRPPNIFDSLLCYSFAILTLSLHPNTQ
ncbi:unnamed protein product [Danaus chrysippus]|uniref:(African queen) hypothetical protein n=1 Tax=Danaus chrysippus TaxID=151541 RepID=A0A8J2R8Y9_9NEOP|nr:unnamed protein product [Danaus chrysippus]